MTPLYIILNGIEQRL